MVRYQFPLLSDNVQIHTSYLPRGQLSHLASNLSLCLPFTLVESCTHTWWASVGPGRFMFRNPTVPASRCLLNSIDVQSCGQEWDSVATHYKCFCRDPGVFCLVSSCHFRNTQISHSTSSGHVQICWMVQDCLKWHKVSTFWRSLHLSQ